VTEGGEFLLTSSCHRTQPENIKDAIAKLEGLLVSAAEKPKPRIPTTPPKSATESRIKEKKHHSEIKKFRTYSSRRED